MRLYIIRHGKAERDSPTGLDEDRPLRPRGERQAAWLGECIAHLERSRQRARAASIPAGSRGAGASAGAPIDALILASPYTRARDTARLIQPFLGGPIRYESALEVGCDPRDALALARAHAESIEQGASPALLLVGHNPQLETLTWALSDDDPGAASRAPRAAAGPLRTGEAVAFDLAAGGAFAFVERLRLDDSDDD